MPSGQKVVCTSCMMTIMRKIFPPLMRSILIRYYQNTILLFFSGRTVSLPKNIPTKLLAQCQGHQGEICQENWFLDLAFNHRTIFLQTPGNQAGERTWLSDLLPWMNPRKKREVHRGKAGRELLKGKKS